MESVFTIKYQNKWLIQDVHSLLGTVSLLIGPGLVATNTDYGSTV